MHQPPHDLFGEIPVLESDLQAWVAAVAPRWLYPTRAFRRYCAAYDVAAKVRAAKAAGIFEHITEKPAHAWHVRLSLDVIL